MIRRTTAISIIERGNLRVGLVRLSRKFDEPRRLELTSPSHNDIYSTENKFSYVHAGGLVGEIGVMMKKVSDLTAECETACSAYLIKSEDMDKAIAEFGSILKDNIWKSIGINRALNTKIAAELDEAGPSTEEKRQFLQPSYFKELSFNESFIFDDSSHVAILMFGSIKVEFSIPKNTKNKDKYQTKIIKAPAIIKHEFDAKYEIIDQIFKPMPQNTTPKLLIVPDDKDEEVQMVNLADRVTNFNLIKDKPSKVGIVGVGGLGRTSMARGPNNMRPAAARGMGAPPVPRIASLAEEPGTANSF